MHLQRLKIPNFRNLRDFEITFAANADVNGESRRLRSHAVIGQNGSGKSNMIEAIVTIFRDLDLNEPTAFDYGTGLRSARLSDPDQVRRWASA